METISVGQLIAFAFTAAAASTIGAGILLTAISNLGGKVLFGLFVATAMSCVFFALSLINARTEALQSGKANVWGGLLLVVAWNPNQGILILKNKRVSFVDSNPTVGGGLLILVPWLAEEVAFRAPLETRTTKFTDEDVITREYVPLTVKGALYWRVTDLEKYYLLVSRSIHEVTDGGSRKIRNGYDPADALDRRTLRTGTPQQLEAGEEWLRLLAEEKTRQIVLQTRTGLLVADKVVDGLPAEMQTLVSSDQPAIGSSGLASSIKNRIAEVGRDYGIYIDRVSIQELGLDRGILHQTIEACAAAYEPLIAQRKAQAQRLDADAAAYTRRALLESEASVVGSESLATREALSGMPAVPILGGGFSQMLTNIFESQGTGKRLEGPDNKKALEE